MLKTNRGRKYSLFSALLLSILLLSSCSSTQHKEQSAFRDLYKSGQYDEALSLLKDSEVGKDQDNQLLYYFEKALIHHSKKEYYQSVLTFNKAIKKARQLYTESISKKILKGLVNDKVDKYYGLPYEVSLAYFYASLGHYLIAQQGFYERYTPATPDAKPIKRVDLSKGQRRKELLSARATVVAWDSFLKTLRAQKLGKSVFKDDLLAKTWGAFIHEAIATSQDLQTALLLYRKARELVFKNYNSYKAYNTLSKKFRGDFERLPSLPKSKVKSDYIARTPHQAQLSDFLDRKIISLTKKFRPRRVKNLKTQLGIDPKLIKEVPSYSKNATNITVVLQNGMVPHKKPKRYDIGIEGALKATKNRTARRIITQVGVPLLGAFAANQLGLIPKRASYPGAMIGLYGAQAAVAIATIGFELPIMRSPYDGRAGVLEITDESGAPVKSLKIPIASPLGDIAEESVVENTSALYLRTGLRVAGKHVAAIATAYMTYKSLKKTLPAKWAAVAGYSLASRGISETEKADVRYWSTLPFDVKLRSFHLGPGKYHLKYNFAGKVIDLGVHHVKNNGIPLLINRRLANLY
ncbi:MAG: hypothetical protein HOE90_12325 [Bacteriovoracaceae bacterium]|nr:hypothetical protein [Bacteriovoracaceae bacterium]